MNLPEIIDLERRISYRRMVGHLSRVVPHSTGLLLTFCLTLSGVRAQTGTSPAEALEPNRIAERIQKHRTALATVVVVDSTGAPLAKRLVVVEQTAHRFLFGCRSAPG